jgi:hypothetical protein
MPGFGGTFDINDSLVLVGSKSLKAVASASTFSIATTQSFGDLSTYTGVGSGAPTSGTVGIWVYCASGEITSVTLRMGSSSINYSEVAGVKTYTNGTDTQDGWNYFVFRLTNATTTGTPVWTAVAYARIQAVSTTTPTVIFDYFAIGTGNVIGLNGMGDRRTDYQLYSVTY